MTHAMQKMPSNLCEISRVCKNSSIKALFSCNVQEVAIKPDQEHTLCNQLSD